MKKYFLIAFLLFSLLDAFFFPAAVEAASDNLIVNPSVEEKNGGWPADWSKRKVGNNISVFNYKFDAHSGKRGLYTKVTQYKTGESYWHFKEVPVQGGGHYIYSEYYKASMETELRLRVTDSSGEQTASVLRQVPVADDWTLLEVSFTVPAGAKSVTVMHVTRSLGVLQTDDFSLAQTEGDVEPTPSPSPSPTPTATPVPTSRPTPIPSPTSTPTPTPSGGNPIPNPSLETVSGGDSSLPERWSKYKTGTNNATFSYLNNGHTGGRSIRVDISDYTSGYAYYYFDWAEVEGGQTYDYSVYYKSDSYAEVDAAITLESGEVVYQYLGVSYPSSEWSKFTTQIRLPEGAVKVSIYNLIYAAGYLVTDDYELKKMTTEPFNRAIVTLTFDDFFNSFYDTVFPMFKQYGFTGTAYLVSGDFGNPNILGADKLREMSNYGFEIGSHTVTHAHLPFVSYEEVEYELAQSKADIENLLEVVPVNFASPYGEYNDTVIEQIKKYYGSHRSVDVGFNTKDSFDKYNIKAMSAVSTTTPEMVLEWVDQAIEDKAWLVIVYHDIIEDGGLFTNTPEHLAAVLAGLQARGVAVMTTEQALREVLAQQ